MKGEIFRGRGKIQGLPAGGGKSYADTDTISEMASNNEKEGGSPAKKVSIDVQVIVVR